MSLKAFHVVFVTAAVLLSVGFGVWALVHRSEGTGYALLAGLAFALAAGLVVYGRWFLKKLRDVSYL